MVGTADPNGDGVRDLISFGNSSSNESVRVALSGYATRMLYHGGEVMTGSNGSVNVYITYYWPQFVDSPTTESLINTFVSSLSGSAFWSTLSTYTNSSGTPIPSAMNLAGWKDDKSCTQNCTVTAGGTALTILQNNWGSSLDPNAIYLIIAGNSVSTSAEAHYYNTINGVEVKYAIIPYAGLGQPTPNGDPEADNAISAITHEMAETLTDPTVSGWFSGGSSGPSGTILGEVGDVCGNARGTTYTLSNGALANLYLGGHYWYTQELYENGHLNNHCAGLPFASPPPPLSYPAPLSYWTFDDAQTTAAAPAVATSYDAMPSGNNGAIYNAVIGRQDARKINQSYYFAGQNSAHVAVPYARSLNFASSGMTASMWINIPAGYLPSNQNHIFNVLDKQNGSSGWQIWLNTSNQPGFIADGSGGVVAQVTSTVQLQAGKWYYIAGTYQPPSNVAIYVGDANDNFTMNTATGSSSPLDNSQAIWVGSSAYWQNNYTTGFIDEVALWNSPLSSSEISSIYQRSFDFTSDLF